MKDKIFCVLQRVGRSFMLPIAILPVAGLLLGIGSSLLGLMLLSGWNLTTAKLALVVIFLWCSSPVSSHLIARLEAVTNPKLERKCEVPDEIRKSIEEQNQQRGDV